MYIPSVLRAHNGFCFHLHPLSANNCDAIKSVSLICRQNFQRCRILELIEKNDNLRSEGASVETYVSAPATSIALQPTFCAYTTGI
jgi:hypothetical protein